LALVVARTLLGLGWNAHTIVLQEILVIRIMGAQGGFVWKEELVFRGIYTLLY